jgi:hypothetical protein
MRAMRRARGSTWALAGWATFALAGAGSAWAAPPAEVAQAGERWEASEILDALGVPSDTSVRADLVWIDAPFPPSPKRMPPPTEGHGTEECQLAAAVDREGRVRRAVVVACPAAFIRAVRPTLRRWRAAADPARPELVVWVGRLTFVLGGPPPR